MYSVDEIQQIMLWSQEYATLTPERFLFGRNAVPAQYKKAVAMQLRLSRSLASKLPSWSEVGVYMPEGINLEQASSQITAEYKRTFVLEHDVLLDLTGGMGVDFWAMTSIAEKAIYVEQNADLYAASSYNLPRLLLGRDVTLVNADSSMMLRALVDQYQPTLVYIDPARREDIIGSKRVYAIEDCTPSLYEVVHQMREMNVDLLPRLVVKLSPMLDIKHTLEHLGCIGRIEIVAVKGEVKELLLVIDLSADTRGLDEVPIRAIDLDAQGVRSSFEGTFAQERSAEICLADDLCRYVYEPNGAVMKSGLFRHVGAHYGLSKLHQHTHLYTSDELMSDFAGRIFEVESVIPFRSSEIKGLNKHIGPCMIAVRNFPLGAEPLRKKLGIKDGGNRMLLATTLANEEHVLLLCRPLLP